MGTKSIRSSGTQLNQRGVTQGNTLVDPISGLPISVTTDGNGLKRLAVDADLTVSNVTVNTDDLKPDADQVGIGDPNTGYFVKVNPDGSIDTNVSINATNDNIAISDGTNELKINPDGSLNVNINPLAAPLIRNILATNANTEYFYAFPANTKKFSLRTRGQAKIQLAFVSGQSGIEFITIFPGNNYEEIGLKLTGVTAYFQLSKAGETVEILSWT